MDNGVEFSPDDCLGDLPQKEDKRLARILKAAGTAHYSVEVMSFVVRLLECRVEDELELIKEALRGAIRSTNFQYAVDLSNFVRSYIDGSIEVDSVDYVDFEKVKQLLLKLMSQLYLCYSMVDEAKMGWQISGKGYQRTYCLPHPKVPWQPHENVLCGCGFCQSN